MKYFESNTYKGNINRIIEMHEGGMGPHAIAGTFKDNNIELEGHQAKAIIDSIAPLKSAKLPKKVARAAIKKTQETFGSDPLIA